MLVQVLQDDCSTVNGLKSKFRYWIIVKNVLYIYYVVYLIWFHFCISTSCGYIHRIEDLIIT